MRTRIVETKKVQELRTRAIRYKHQNVPETKSRGKVIEEVLRELGLWDKKGEMDKL